MLHRAVRAEIAGTVLHYAAGQEDLGIHFLAHAYPRIGLRVLEQYVVTGFVLLDEIVFQQQGIRLAVNHRVLEVCNAGYQYGCLRGEAGRIDEILRDTLVEVLGLAHINDGSRGVIVTVNARGVRQKAYFFLEGHFPAWEK